MRTAMTRVGLVALLLLTGGCGDDAETEADDSRDPTAIEMDSEDRVQPPEATTSRGEDATEDERVATGSAADCPQADEVEVTAKHPAHEDYASLGWDDLGAVFAKRVAAALGADGTAIKIYMATTEVTPDQVGATGQREVLGEEAYVVVTLTDGPGGHPEAGDYTFTDDSKARHRMSLKIQRGGKGYSIREKNWGKPDATGSAEIAYLGEQRVCGTFTLEDPWRTVEGAFDAEIHDTVSGDLARAGS